jgi:ABC-type multidrug transport system fused ATPase/permease subunit
MFFLSSQIVQQTLEHAQKEDPSRTSIVIAHRLSTIRSCDLICILDRGYIIESGTHMDLMQQQGAYYKMLVRNSL